MAIAWRVGDRIENRWEIVDIHKGGMGIVYIVHDNEWNIMMAAKGFQDAVFARDPRVADRFRQEAEVWIGLDCHPNITQAMLVKNIHDRPLIFLEFVDTDLDHWISSGRLSDDLAQVLRFAIQFCDGIGYAYSKGIKTHRDVKPSNCLVTSAGILKVSDFGLVSIWDVLDSEESAPHQEGARRAAGPPPPILTPTGVGLGTPAYMAPEQFLDARRVDGRADVYAFGIMLYEMLTGALPFRGGTYAEWADLHLRMRVPDLPSKRPAELNAMIQRCVSKEPSARFATFDEIRQCLESLYKNLTGEVAPPCPPATALDSAQWRRKGIGLADLGHLHEALESFDRSLDCDANDSATWQCKGMALSRMGKRAEALQCSERAIAIDPTSAKAWSSNAVDLLDLGRNEESLKSAQRAVELDPDDWTSWPVIAATLNRLQRYDEALDAAVHALHIYADSATAWVQKGKALRALGQNHEAIDSLDRALDLNGNYETALQEKAEILIDLGRCEDAIPLLDTAIGLAPNEWATWWDKGVALGALKKSPTEEFKCFDRCVQLAPQFSHAWYRRGVALQDLGRIEAALDSYEHALRLDPEYRDALKGMANVLRESKRGNEALKYDEKLINLDPNDPTGWNDKGASYCSIGRWREALVCFDQALKLDPNHRLARMNRPVVQDILDAGG